jgi:hypothetical protein
MIGFENPFIRYVILPNIMNFTTFKLDVILGKDARTKLSHGGIQDKMNTEHTKNEIFVVLKLAELCNCDCLSVFAEIC